MNNMTEQNPEKEIKINDVDEDFAYDSFLNQIGVGKDMSSKQNIIDNGSDSEEEQQAAAWHDSDDENIMVRNLLTQRLISPKFQG
jgi:hypothetical protein